MALTCAEGAPSTPSRTDETAYQYGVPFTSIVSMCCSIVLVATSAPTFPRVVDR
ncbi:MAG: hypothetical protein IPQ09_01170 [Myxococcales bacterium]|nr:hypothetical protein [Myxococcales bacterium]